MCQISFKGSSCDHMACVIVSGCIIVSCLLADFLSFLEKTTSILQSLLVYYFGGGCMVHVHVHFVYTSWAKEASREVLAVIAYDLFISDIKATCLNFFPIKLAW